MPAPTEAADASLGRLQVSLLAAVLFFANPIAFTLANFWERISSDLLAALLFLQLEGVYLVLSLVTGAAIVRKRPIVWLWLIPVVLAALLLVAQLGFQLSHRFAEGAP